MSKAQNPPKNQFVPEKKAESPPLEHIVTRSQKSETFYRIAGFEDLPENLPRVDAKQGIEPEFETFDRLQETIKLGQAIDEQIIEKLKRLSVSCEADDNSDGDSNVESDGNVSATSVEVTETFQNRNTEGLAEVGKKIIKFFHSGDKEKGREEADAEDIENVLVRTNKLSIAEETNIKDRFTAEIPEESKSATIKENCFVADKRLITSEVSEPFANFKPVKSSGTFLKIIKMDGENEDREKYFCSGRDGKSFDRNKMIKLNDGFLQPPSFKGTIDDEPRSWLEHIDHWTEYKGIEERQLMLLVPLLLKGTALEWFHSLKDAQKRDWGAFRRQFADRFFPSAVDKLKGMQDMWNTKQKAGQSVDDFVGFMQKQQRLYQNLSEESLKMAILLGLRSDIKKHVIQSNPQSRSDLIQAAKIAEQAARMTEGEDSPDSQRIQRIEQLVLDLASGKTTSVNPMRREDNQPNY